MQVLKWIAGVGSLVLVGSAMVVVADDVKPREEQPKAEAPHHRGRARLAKEYSELPDLTEDQKQKLLDIHEKADQEVTAIRAKEKADSKALLTDAQQKELEAIDIRLKEEARAKRSEQRLEERVKTDEEKLKELKDHEGPGATTKPADAK